MLQKTSSLFLYILFLFTIHGCTSRSTVSNYSEIIYPKWFWQPPTNFLSAVGYARTYYDRQSSVDVATENAIEQLARQLQVNISGESIAMNDQQAEKFQETISEGLHQRITNSYYLLNTFVTPKLTVVLISEQERNVSDKITPMSKNKPDWLYQIPNENEYEYGVGSSNLTYFPETAWQKAEKRAIIDLAANLHSKIGSVNSHSTAYHQNISSSKTKIQLQNVLVIARWFSIQDGSYHVLVRMIK
ncbi:hypothetical protein CMK18_10545 [Candidatus Poribacteria bacterium]|nr:hypothetical protein [Candidatus Poribacteria bacterium]